eukprot:g66005.t1
MPFIYANQAHPNMIITEEDKARPVKKVHLDKAQHLKYKFQPVYIPIEGGTDIVYKNPQDGKWYEDPACEPANPRVTIYCLTKSEACTGFCKRRLKEEARNMGILLAYKQPSKFELVIESGKGKGDMFYDGQPLKLPDAVMVRLGAAINYFGQAVLRQFQELDVKIFNDCRGMEVSRDKLFTGQVLATQGVPIPKSLLAEPSCEPEMIGRTLGWPVIMKAVSGSQGAFVWKFNSPEEMKVELPKVLAEHHFTYVVFQQYVKASVGKDLRLMVANGKVIGGVMRISTVGFKSNIHQGGVPHKLSTIKQELRDMAVNATKYCSLDIAGVDMLLDEEGYKVCEINSSPGWDARLEEHNGANVAKEMLQGVVDWAVDFCRKKTIRRHKRTLQRVELQDDHCAMVSKDAPNKKQKTEEEVHSSP